MQNKHLKKNLEAIVENKEAQKYLKSRKCEDECNGKVKVTTMDELTPLIGKKVIVKDKQIGIFLTEMEKCMLLIMCVHIKKDRYLKVL